MFCRVIFPSRKPRKPRPTYASVCTALPGVGCRTKTRFQYEWCASCRYLSRSRRAAPKEAPRG